MNEATATLEDSSAVAGATAAPRIYTALNEEPGEHPPLRHSVGPRESFSCGGSIRRAKRLPLAKPLTNADRRMKY